MESFAELIKKEEVSESLQTSYLAPNKLNRY